MTLTADQARVGLPPEPSLGGIQVEGDTAPPAPADAVGVTRGEQISLEGGVSAKFGNDTSAPVRLLLVSLAPGEGGPDSVIRTTGRRDRVRWAAPFPFRAVRPEMPAALRPRSACSRWVRC